MPYWKMTFSCIDGWYLEGRASRVCILSAETSLDALCDEVLASFDFDNDHMHAFYTGRTHGVGGNREEILNEETVLSDIFPLPTSHALFMNFDLGDNWWFKITRTKVLTDHAGDAPIIISRRGESPAQSPDNDDE